MDDATENLLNQFNLNGFMDQISDNRLKEEKEKFDELTNNEEKK